MNQFNNGGFPPGHGGGMVPQQQQQQQFAPQQQQMMAPQQQQMMQQPQQQQMMQQPQQQQQMQGGGGFGGMFEGFNDVRGGGSSVYADPGAYLFKVVECGNHKGQDGMDSFFSELEVVQSTNVHHPPGTRISHVVKFKNPQWKAGYQRRVKNYLFNIIKGFAPDTLEQSVTDAVWLWATSAEQPLANKFVRGQFAPATSNGGNTYTKEAWSVWGGPGHDPGPAFNGAADEYAGGMAQPQLMPPAQQPAPQQFAQQQVQPQIIDVNQPPAQAAGGGFGQPSNFGQPQAAPQPAPAQQQQFAPQPAPAQQQQFAPQPAPAQQQQFAPQPAPAQQQQQQQQQLPPMANPQVGTFNGQ